MSTPPFVELPDGVRRTTVATRRGEFAALRADPPTGERVRPQVLLVPGYSGSKEDFLALLRPVADAGHPVVAIDLRGQYETPGPVAAQAYTTAALGADVSAVLDVLGARGPVHLLGHSFGGLVTRSALLDGAAGVCSYTLLGSGPAAIVGPRQRLARLLVDVVARFGSTVVSALMQQFELRKPGPKPPAEVVAFLRERYVRSSPFALVAMARAVLTEADRVDELAGVPVPKLVAYGDLDDAWPPALQREMADRLGARCEVFTGAGHSPNADTPAELAEALLSFWAEAELAEAELAEAEPPGLTAEAQEVAS